MSNRTITGKEALEHIKNVIENFEDSTEKLFYLYNQIIGNGISYDENNDTIIIHDDLPTGYKL